MTFDVITEKLKQVTTDKTIFGPNFITDDFVLGFDENQTQSGSLLRYFSKNSNQQMKVCYKKPKFESSALELSSKNELIKCLFVAGNLLLFDTKKQIFLDVDTRQYNQGMCILSHDKKSCIVSKGFANSLSLVTYTSKLSIQKLKGKFGQACFSYNDSCIYCLDMGNSLIKKYCLNNHSFEMMMSFDAENYPNYRLFPMQTGGFLMYWPQLNYVHIKPNNSNQND
jgi:hypothetical protein